MGSNPTLSAILYKYIIINTLQDNIRAMRQKHVTEINPDSAMAIDTIDTKYLHLWDGRWLFDYMSLTPSLYHFSKKIGVKTLYQYKLLIAECKPVHISSGVWNSNTELDAVQ